MEPDFKKEHANMMQKLKDKQLKAKQGMVQYKIEYRQKLFIDIGFIVFIGVIGIGFIIYY